MRAVQCSSYDRRPFRGRFYTWVPYVDGKSLWLILTRRYCDICVVWYINTSFFGNTKIKKPKYFRVSICLSKNIIATSDVIKR